MTPIAPPATYPSGALRLTLSGSQSGGLEVRNHGTFLGNDLHIDDVVGTAIVMAEGSYMASARAVVSANNHSGLEGLVVTENSTAEVPLGVHSHCGGNGIQATYNRFVYANDRLSGPTGTWNLGLHDDAAALHVERPDGAIILP